MSYLALFYAVVIIGLVLTFVIAAALGGHAAIRHFGVWLRHAANPLSPVGGYVAPHIGILLAAVLVIIVVSLTTGPTGRPENGGYQPAALPPRIILHGGPLPPDASLARYVVRIHDQGTSASSVGQTLSTIVEITQAERGHRDAFSAGYVYDQIAGRVDAGATYPAAFAILIDQGDPHLRDFPHDGTDFFVQPNALVRVAAYPYRFTAWHTISASDTYTIRDELTHGHPLGIAIPVRDTLANHFGADGVIADDPGAFHFYQSMTIIGYSPVGVTALNSRGPAYGDNGRVILSWGFIANVGATIVVGIPRPRHHAHPPTPTPVPTSMPAHHATRFHLQRVFRSYHRAHRLSPVSAYGHHGLTAAGALLKAHHHLGGYISSSSKRGYVLYRYAHGVAACFSATHRCHVVVH